MKVATVSRKLFRLKTLVRYIFQLKLFMRTGGLQQFEVLTFGYAKNGHTGVPEVV